MIKDELKKMFKELNEKYGFEWVGDNSLRLDYKPLNDDIEFKRGLGMKIFTYEIDEYCDNRICFKLNE